MLPFAGGNRLCHGLCPVDLARARRLPWTGIAAAVLASLLVLNTGCGPSDEEVTRAAEESISSIAAIAVANLKCSVDEMFSGGGEASRVMEANASRMEDLTDSLQNNPDTSNRDKMRAIEEMDDLYETWSEDLDRIGCELPSSQPGDDS